MSKPNVTTTKPNFAKIADEKVWITIDPVTSGDFLQDEIMIDDGWTFPASMPGGLLISTGAHAPRKSDEGGLTFRLEDGDASDTAHTLRVTMVGSKGSERIYDLKITVSA